MKQFKNAISAFTLFLFSSALSAQNQDLPINGFQKIFPKRKISRTESVASNLYKPGKSLNYYWNALDWQLTGHSLMTYTPVGKLATKIDSGFMYRKTSYTYDAEQRETERLDQNFNYVNSLWENFHREVHIFDSQGAIQENRTEQWIGNSWSMQSGEKHNRNYNPQNLLLEDVQLSWSMQNSVWQNDYMETAFLYDGQSRLQSYVSKDWADSVWVNQEKSLWQYGPDNKPNQVILQDWNGTAFVDSTRIIDISWNYWNGNLSQSDPSQYTMQKLIGGNWTNSMRFTITRDLNGSVTYLNEVFFNSSWMPSTRMRSVFDDQQNPVVMINEDYNPGTLSFDTSFCISYQNTYDNQGRILVQILNNWDSDLHQFEPAAKQEFSQHSMFTSANTRRTNSRLKATPNPVLSGSSLRIPGASGTYQIRTMTGQLIRAGELRYDSSVSTKSLSTGIYIIDFLNENKAPESLRISVQ
jgi:hypothetical protein